MGSGLRLSWMYRELHTLIELITRSAMHAFENFAASNWRSSH